jgi:hypothetical protein
MKMTWARNFDIDSITLIWETTKVERKPGGIDFGKTKEKQNFQKYRVKYVTEVKQMKTIMPSRSGNWALSCALQGHSQWQGREGQMRIPSYILRSTSPSYEAKILVCGPCLCKIPTCLCSSVRLDRKDPKELASISDWVVIVREEWKGQSHDRRGILSEAGEGVFLSLALYFTLALRDLCQSLKEKRQ